MARAPNFYYQNPMGAIGDGLARALFGDPAAAQEQARVQAEMDARAAQAERDRAAAGVDIEKTAGLRTGNQAQTGLPGLVGEWLRANQPPPPGPTVDSPAFADFDTPLPAPEPQPDPTETLAALIGAIGQIQGDKIDPRHIMGAAGAFGGDDELARRGMIAQGQTPGEEFAITSERADELAEAGYASELAKALGVAEINNRDDVPVAKINADARVQDSLIDNRDDIPVAEIRAGASRDVAGIKAGGNLNAGSVAQSLFPGVRVTQVARDPNSALGRANPGSHHNRGTNAVDVAPIPGMTFQQYVQKYRDAGYQIVEAIDEVKNPSSHATGPHWHVVLAGGGAAGKPGKPTAVSAAANKGLIDELTRQLPAYADSSPRAQAQVLARATTLYQQTGNMAQAAQQAIADQRRGASEQKNPSPANRRPVNGPLSQASSAFISRASGQRLSVEQAAKLPKGTKFVGVDGVERIRQ